MQAIVKTQRKVNLFHQKKHKVLKKMTQLIVLNLRLVVARNQIHNLVKALKINLNNIVKLIKLTNRILIQSKLLSLVNQTIITLKQAKMIQKILKVQNLLHHLTIIHLIHNRRNQKQLQMKVKQVLQVKLNQLHQTLNLKLQRKIPTVNHLQVLHQVNPQNKIH